MEEDRMRLAGRVALITGAGAGLGEESALLFAEEGAQVVAVDIVAERAEAVAAEITARGGAAIGLAADVSDEPQVAAAVAAAVARFGKLDILFANAGISDEGLGLVP